MDLFWFRAVDINKQHAGTIASSGCTQQLLIEHAYVLQRWLSVWPPATIGNVAIVQEGGYPGVERNGQLGGRPQWRLVDPDLGRCTNGMVVLCTPRLLLDDEALHTALMAGFMFCVQIGSCTWLRLTYVTFTLRNVGWGGRYLLRHYHIGSFGWKLVLWEF